jgi:adenylate kinase
VGSSNQLLDYLEDVVNPKDAPASTGKHDPASLEAPSLTPFSLGFIIDHHSPSMYPERWIDLAVVLRTDNGILYRRLEER